MPRPCTVKDRPLEARAPKEGSIELCRSEDRSPQVRPAKNSLAQIGAIQVRSRHHGVQEPGVLEAAIGQASLGEIRERQPCTGEVEVAKIGVRQFRTLKPMIFGG